MQYKHRQRWGNCSRRCNRNRKRHSIQSLSSYQYVYSPCECYNCMRSARRRNRTSSWSRRTRSASGDSISFLWISSIRASSANRWYHWVRCSTTLPIHQRISFRYTSCTVLSPFDLPPSLSNSSSCITTSSYCSSAGRTFCSSSEWEFTTGARRTRSQNQFSSGETRKSKKSWIFS